MSKFISTNLSYKHFFYSPSKILKLKKKSFFMVSLFVVFAVFIVVFFGLFKPIISGTATLVIAFQGQNERVFRGEVIQDMTVLDAILASAEAGDIRFRYFVNDQNEVEIVIINGQDQLRIDKQLIFSLNGEFIKSENIHKTHIDPGDEIKINIISILE